MLRLNVKKQLDPFELVISEEIPLQGVTAIFGPSGAGKTSLLRLIAGFESGLGSIVFADVTWFDSTKRINVRPHKRPVGYVHQQPLLFEHLSVQGNINLPLRFNKHRTQRTKSNDVIEAFDLSKLLTNSPATLSGGERQRVAMAQMVLSQPAIMLLDEPLAGLDLDRKAEILPFLHTLAYQLNIPTLYVSHQVDEISHICDRVLVLQQGKVKQFEQTSALFEHLDLHTLSGRLESGSIIQASCLNHDESYELTHLQVDGQAISVPLIRSLGVGQAAYVRIRTRDVSISLSRPADISIRNVLKGIVASITPLDDSPFVEVEIRCGDAKILSRITRAALDSLQLDVDQEVFALIKSVSFDSL